MTRSKFPINNEEKFNKFLVEEYLKFGSVDEVIRQHSNDIPISYASYQRILDKWGVVKAAGPRSRLTEVLEFFSHFAKDNISLEDFYKKTPESFKTSAVTLYRIIGYIKEDITRRVGVTLIITPHDTKKKVLLARDISTPKVELGKNYGQLTCPIGYARKRDSRNKNIARVLQQEVFTKKVIGKSFPKELISEHVKPFMYLDIADVRVSVYHIQLPKDLSSLENFSSFKLKNYSYHHMDEILGGKLNLRSGVKEAVTGYKRYLGLVNRNLVVNPLQVKSVMNKELATIAVEVES